jgi:hypothetical protein
VGAALATAVLLAPLTPSCGDVAVGYAASYSSPSPVAGPEPELTLEVPPPPFSDDAIFPCTDCHDPELPVRTTRRPMKMAHQEIELRHDEEHRWCLDCHDEANRDVLRLASGATVSFEESYLLCGQCHGDKYRDWRAGVHGRRTGNWDGQKSYLLCVHCHDSHTPAFKPIEPDPPPEPPRRTP